MFRSFASFARFPLAGLVVLALFPTVLPAVSAASAEPEAVRSAPEPGKGNLEFEENRGQFPAPVRYLARSTGANIFLTAEEAVYVMRADCGNPAAAKCDESRHFALRMKFAGANRDSLHSGEADTGHRSNYLRGDADQFVTEIPNFSRVRMNGVYDGIDVVWHGLANGAVRYDFVVGPFVDPEPIALTFEGADSVALDGNGDLLVETPAGTIRQGRPVTFQESDGIRHEVESSFRIDNGNTVRFELGTYDPSLPLTIDPTVTLNNLAFSTLLGSFGDDFANDIAVDANGNSYVTGRTLSATFPTTAGTFDTSANGAEDVFVAKFNASGTGIVFSTFLGGSFYDEGHGIAVDSIGDVYLTGNTLGGFPTTAGTYDTTYNGGIDVFVTKLAASGSSLIYSTYIGASLNDQGNDIAIDAAGNAYVAVRTADAIVDYPTTAGAFDVTHNGVDDVAVTKINPSGNALVYSTFLGGSSIDVPDTIAVNAAGEAFVGGSTTDDVTDFPTTAGAYDTTHNGNNDFFVTKLNAAGSALGYSTFIGGSNIDNLGGLAVDGANQVYVAGTVGTGYPTTPGVFDTTAAGSNEIGVSKLNAAGSALVYSTFIGGIQGENANSLAVDRFGNAYVTGSNFDGDYPTTAGAPDTTYNGLNDAVLTVLNQNASALLMSTYLGGGGTDVSNGVALDPAGNVYLTGRSTLSGAAFPTNPEAYQNFNSGGSDAFVAKFGDFVIGGRVIDATTGNPVSNVMVALSGQVSGNVLTGADGRFGFLDTVPGEPHAVSATRAGYTINPSIFNIAGLANNRELVFVATVGSPTGGSGGTLRFENLSYSKAENGTSVTATVRRVGEIQTLDPVTVDFSTSSGTAEADSDFVPANGVLTFNAGETAKTITVQLVDNAQLEPREDFTIALSNPTNSAEIEAGRGTALVRIFDEDLGDGSLLISEFRQRGRLGPNDEFVKLFNPNDFDVTVQTADGSSGIVLARTSGAALTPVATIPNLVTIPARGYYLLTNNNPVGGFSVIDYPTGRGSTTMVGDQVFASDIPDNDTLVLVRTSDPNGFVPANVVDSVGFEVSAWHAGKPLPAIVAQNGEMSFVRRFAADGLADSGSSLGDFLIVDNRAAVLSGQSQKSVLTALGAPAPATTESLRLMRPSEIAVNEIGGGVFDPQPVPNGPQGTLTVYRTVTNNTDQPLTALRLRAADFPTAGSALQMRYSSRPDFRLMTSADEPNGARGLTIAAERLQPSGGGINTALSVESVTATTPLLPGQTITVAVRFGIVRYGRLPLVLVAEAGR